MLRLPSDPLAPAAMTPAPPPVPEPEPHGRTRAQHTAFVRRRETAQEAIARHTAAEPASIGSPGSAEKEPDDVAPRRRWQPTFDELAPELIAGLVSARQEQDRIMSSSPRKVAPRRQRTGGGTRAARERVHRAAGQWDKLCDATEAAAAASAAIAASRLQRAGWADVAAEVWQAYASSPSVPVSSQKYATFLPESRDADGRLKARVVAAAAPAVGEISAGAGERFVVYTSEDAPPEACKVTMQQPCGGVAEGRKCDEKQLWVHDTAALKTLRVPRLAEAVAGASAGVLGDGWGAGGLVCDTRVKDEPEVVLCGNSRVASVSLRNLDQSGALSTTWNAGQSTFRQGSTRVEVTDVALVPGVNAAAFCVVRMRGHGGEDVTDSAIARIRTGATAQGPELLTRGRRCYSSLCVSPSGRVVAWVAWDGPSTAHEGSQLCVAAINADGTINHQWAVDGGGGVSVSSPCFSDLDHLAWLSRAGQGAWSIRVCDSDAKCELNESPYHIDRAAMSCVGQLRSSGSGPERLVCSLPHHSVGQFVTVASHDGADVIAVCTANCDDLDYRLELAGAGITRIWSLCSVDERRVALFAAGVAVPATPLVYDVRFHSVVCIAPPRPPVPLASGPQMLRLAAKRRLSRSYRDDTPPGGEMPAWIFLPPKGAVPPVPQTCGEAPRPGEIPLVIEPHTCWGGAGGWAPDVWDAATQLLCSHGYAVLHVVVPGALHHGDNLRRLGQGIWGTVAPEALAAAVEVCAKRFPIDLHHVCARGRSLDGIIAIRAATARRSFVRAAVAHGLIPDVARWAHARTVGDSGWASSLLRDDTVKETASVAGVRCPCLLLHSAEDPVSPPADVESFVERLRESNHAPVSMRTVPGTAHPPRLRDALPAEIDFINSAMWDPCL